jgi:hypothetical protein
MATETKFYSDEVRARYRTLVRMREDIDNTEAVRECVNPERLELLDQVTLMASCAHKLACHMEARLMLDGIEPDVLGLTLEEVLERPGVFIKAAAAAKLALLRERKGDPKDPLLAMVMEQMVQGTCEEALERLDTTAREVCPAIKASLLMGHVDKALETAMKLVRHTSTCDCADCDKMREVLDAAGMIRLVQQFVESGPGSEADPMPDEKE